MKVDRRSKILEIISSKNIETQEELGSELRRAGFKVTQATVSRDIKNLNLIKIIDSDGKYKYVPGSGKDIEEITRLSSLLRHTINSIENIDKMIIIKTISASANTAAEAIDSLGIPDIAGTIAGDNTIFMMTRSSSKALEIKEKLTELLV